MIRISASTIDTLIFAIEAQQKNFYSEDLKRNCLINFIKKIKCEEVEDTIWTIRGKEFEKLGDSGSLTEFEKEYKLSTLEKQIEFYKDFNEEFCLHGFTDYLDKKRKIIIDLKRKNKTTLYDFINSTQTLFYLYANPWANEIIYLCGVSQSKEVLPKNIKYKKYVITKDMLGNDEGIKKLILARLDIFKEYIQMLGLEEELIKNYSI